MKYCRKCITPEKHPLSDFDENGVCRFCREYKEPDPAKRETQRQEMEQAFKNTRGKGKYDCLLLFSGGKDSTYLLYQLINEYHLRVLTFSVDMSFEKDIAIENIREVANKLNVDNVMVTPKRSFYIKLFKNILTNEAMEPPAFRWIDRESSGNIRIPFVQQVCYVCASLIIGYAIRYAAYNDIPLVSGGHAPPMPSYSFCEAIQKQIQSDWTPKALYNEPFTEDDRKYFWNPQREKEHIKNIPCFWAPYYLWEYNPVGIRKKCHDLGLLSLKKSNPGKTNCKINDFLHAQDAKVDGYLPFVREYGDMVRSKFFSRKLGLLARFYIKTKIRLGFYNSLFKKMYHILGIDAANIKRN